MIHKIRAQINKCNNAMAEIGFGTVIDGMDVGPRTKKFLEEMKNLIAILPFAESKLVAAIKSQIKILESQTKIHPFAFGQLQAFLTSISINYGNLCAKKIFISHSSKDKIIITHFVEKILMLGIGISSDDIFCTSIETMGLQNGNDMRNHIRQNILGCDFAFLMISKSYSKSSICLNEMGAVWSGQIPNVNVFLLPGCELPQSIGWLYEVKKADMLCNSQNLNQLFETLTKTYGMDRNVAEWGRQRDNFLNTVQDFSSPSWIKRLFRRLFRFSAY